MASRVSKRPRLFCASNQQALPIHTRSFMSGHRSGIDRLVFAYQIKMNCLEN